MAQNRERRRRLVINSPLQSRFVVALCWPIVACLTLTAALLAWFGNRLASQAMEAGVALPALTPILVMVIAFMTCSAAYMVWHFVKVSNRVVGPMYRIQKTLDDVRKGDTSRRVRLRDGDFLASTADNVNLLLDWLEERVPCEPRTDDAEGPQGKITAPATKATTAKQPARTETKRG